MCRRLAEDFGICYYCTMATKPSSLPLLVTTGVFLVFLVGIAVATSILTKQASEKLAKQKAAQSTSQTPTSAPQEYSIYLSLPKTFPKDMPLMRSFIVTATNEDKHQWSASFFTTLGVSELTDFYNKELPNAGWKITNRSQGGGITVIYAAKDTRDAVVAIGKGEGGMAVSLTIVKHVP